jgi:hypothetical protein
MAGVTAIASIDTVGTATSFPSSSITSGSANVTVSSTAGITPGSGVLGSGIPTGATVVSITSATVFVMSANATATITSAVTITTKTLSTADQKLITVNSGWYRDQFNNVTQLSYAAPSGVGGSSSILAQSAVIYDNPVTIVPATVTTAFGVEAAVKATTSDELAHEPLRQATWYESLWAFTCTVNASTLTLYYRKYEILGFCNTEPSL